MAEIKHAELRAWDIFGRNVRITPREMRALALHPMNLLFLALIIAAFVTFDVANLQDRLSMLQSGVVWITAVPFQVGLYFLLAAGWGLAQRGTKLFAIYLPVLGLSAFAVNYPLSLLHAAAYAGGSFYDFASVAHFVNGVFTNLIFEALYFAFVFPYVRMLIRKRDTVTPRRISAAGRHFAIDQILSLHGQQHYVLISTPEGQHRVRARLGDLVSQTRDEDGVLAHRSHWVSRSAIAELLTENGSDLIVTVTGERLPVARPRKEEVRRWFASREGRTGPDARGMNGG